MQVLNGTAAADTYGDDIRNRTHECTNDILFIHSFMELQKKEDGGRHFLPRKKC